MSSKSTRTPSGTSSPGHGNSPNVHRWQLAEEAYLSAHDPNRPGIALSKFHSNDSWRITPHEISTALTVNELDLKSLQAIDGGLSYWASWITFLAKARDVTGAWIEVS